MIPALTTRAGNTQDDQQTGQLVAHALTGEGHDASEDGTGRGTPLVAAPLSHGSNPNLNMAGRRREDDENLVAFHPTQDPISGPISHALGSEESGSVAIAGTLREHVRPGSNTDASIVQGASVRRLTPVECCRLQALPDDWFHGVDPCPDSRMYAGLGDAVTASVAEWLGRRIALALTRRAQ